MTPAQAAAVFAIIIGDALLTNGTIAASDCTSDNKIPTTAVIFACVATF